MHEYRTAVAVGRLVAAIGWIVVVIAMIVIVVSLLGARQVGVGVMFALFPAIGVAIGGLLLVCQGQLTQAAAHTASSSARAADAMERMLYKPGTPGPHPTTMVRS